MQRSVVVVGAGPAGIMAATEAATRGCRVTLVDEASLPGGQIYRQAAPALTGGDYADPAESARKRALLGRFSAVLPQIDYRPATSVYAVFGNGEVHISEGGTTEVLNSDAVVLATGVRELAIPFPGWTIPGVMFAGGAQAILKAQRVIPGRNIVVAGCGPLPIVVAAQLVRAGGTVAALAPLKPMIAALRHPAALWHGRSIVLEGLRYMWSVRRVPRLMGHVPVRAIGRERLEGVVLARVDDNGSAIAGTEREISCDLLAVNYGFVANSELAAMTGVRMRHDPLRGGWLPIADEFGRTSVSRIFVAGDAAGLRGALNAENEGIIVGAAAAEARATGAPAMTPTLAGAILNRRRSQLFQEAVGPLLQVSDGLWNIVTDETVVCRCENVSLGAIRATLSGGHTTPNAIKRNVRAGMGWCGGRSCLRSVAALAKLHAGVEPAAMMTPRPMNRPVTFAAIARQKKVAVK
ncbi:FAD-dependent oxidoreductase [Leptospira interrogans]